MKKIKDSFEISNIWIAIFFIAILEIIALNKGINGQMMRISVAAIAGLAGLATPGSKIAEKIKGVFKGG